MAFPELFLPILIFAGSYFCAIFVFREIREKLDPRDKKGLYSKLYLSARSLCVTNRFLSSSINFILDSCPIWTGLMKHACRVGYVV